MGCISRGWNTDLTLSPRGRGWARSARVRGRAVAGRLARWKQAEDRPVRPLIRPFGPPSPARGEGTFKQASLRGNVFDFDDGRLGAGRLPVTKHGESARVVSIAFEG